MTNTGRAIRHTAGGGNDPLSASEVDEQLSGQPGTRTPSPPPQTSTPTSAAPAAGRRVSTPTAGGTVISRCEAGGVRVLQAVPAQGYSVDPEDDEVDDHPSVKFQQGDREIEVRLRCVNGLPEAEIKTDD